MYSVVESTNKPQGYIKMINLNFLRLFKPRRVTKQSLELKLLECQLKMAQASVNAQQYKSYFWLLLIVVCVATMVSTMKVKSAKGQSCMGYVCVADESQRYTKLGYGELDPNKEVKNVFWYRYHTPFTQGSSQRFSEVVLTMIPRLKKGDVFVVDINSPGGDATACGADYESVMMMRRQGVKVIAVVDHNALSCGYYLASAAEFIYSSKTANVGNIGVYLSMQRRGLGADDKSPEVIGSTRTKELFGGSAPKDDKDRELLRKYVLDNYDLFVQQVEVNRGMLISDKERAYSGLPFTGVTALKLGLVDKNISSEQIRLALHQSNFRIVGVNSSRPRTLVEVAQTI